MKHTAYKFSIITLALVLLLSLTAFLGIHFIPAKAEGTVTVSGTNVFTATEDANVIVDKQDDKYYTMFSLASNDDSVSYRRNLAYNWYSGVTTGEGDDAVSTVEHGMFNMEIGFKNTSFEKFIITFESQQYNKSKDNKSLNYVIFFPENNGVKVLITNNKDASKSDAGDKVLNADHIVIKFTEKLAGAYAVSVGNEGGESVTGELKNVGGNFAKSSTSSSNPVYPLIFNAEFDKDAESKAASMVLYSLNGQAFEVSNASHDDKNDYYYGGTVLDNKPAVLCLNEEFVYFTQGGEVDVDYTVVDVLRSSPSSTVYYYVLDYDQYVNKELDYNDKELFTEVEDDILLETDVDKYLPVADDLNGTKFDAYNADGKLNKLKVDMLVKAYIEIKDTTASTGTPDVIYLDWYVSDGYKVKVNGSDFLAVAEDKLGATYNYDGSDGKTWEQIKADYQAKVDELANDLSAGSSSYLYLPSAESLFADNATAYTDLKLSVYFYHDSQSSNTNLSTNNLSINVSKQGAYTFTIYATDAAGNNMYYIDEDGNIEEFASSKVWDMYNDKENGLYDKLPWFTFNVGYTGVQFEETPGKQSTAYVGTSYTSASFKINGISGSYDTRYRLFLFDRAGFYNDYKDNAAYNNGVFSYEQFIEKMDKLYEGAETRKYFTEILQVSESDAEYETFKDYGWSNSSTSFTPQDDNAFYMIRAEVTDKQFVTEPVTCSLAVVASVNAKTISGPNDWLANNVASVVLLSIAGAAFVGIILLFVIKPKNKDDVDVQFENEKKKQKKSK